jgi:hypothetical protein
VIEEAASIGRVYRAHASEPRWPSVLAALVALGLYVALPEEMAGGPAVAGAVHFAIPAVVLMLLAPLALGAPHRHAAESAGHRRAAFGLTGLLSVANLLALALRLGTRQSVWRSSGCPVRQEEGLKDASVAFSC